MQKAVTPPELPLSDIIDDIRAHHRQRCFVMEQRKRMQLTLAAYIRMTLGWRKDLPDSDRKRIAKEALELTEATEIDNPEDVAAGVPARKRRRLLAPKNVSIDHPQYDVIAASISARSPFDHLEKVATKEMERLAMQLPVWKGWAEGVRAFGSRSLAVIIGEAGDLSSYPTHSHLWKRLGLAVINGIRQGGLRKTASAQDWIAHGYNAERRSTVFVIGECLVKQGEHYRQVYLDRKKYEVEQAEAKGLIVLPATKIPKRKNATEKEITRECGYDTTKYRSVGHIHHRSQRYAEKRLIRDLYKAWLRTRRKANTKAPEKDEQGLPSANNLTA